MRRTIFIALLVLSAAALVANAFIAYAYLNLAAIVERNRGRILAKLSDEIGRPIEIRNLEVRRGWLVSLTVRGVKIGDDPSFSQLPFIVAENVTVHLRLWPLLRGKAKISDVVVNKPVIRLLRDGRRGLNLETLGSTKVRRHPALASLRMDSLIVKDGTIQYRDAEIKAEPLEIRHVDFHLSNLDGYQPFGVALWAAVLTDSQNVQISGRIGPLIREGVFEASRVPLRLEFNLSQIDLEHVRAFFEFAAPIPAKFVISGPLTLTGTVEGEVGQALFSFRTDLTHDRVRYGTWFDKPSGIPMAMTLHPSATAARGLSGTLNLADVALTADNIEFDSARFRARLDSNSFDIASLSRTMPLLAAWGLFGKAEGHASIQFLGGTPELEGVVKVVEAGALRPGARLPIFSGFTATVGFARNSLTLPQTDFMLGQAHAGIEVQIDSIAPLKARYRFTTDSLKPAQLLPARSPREILNRLLVSGVASGSLAAPALNMKIQSANGEFAAMPYRDLDLTAAYADKRLSTHPLKIAVFGGSLTANGDMLLGAAPQFDFSCGVQRLSAEQLLRWQRPRSPMLRGLLTGNFRVTGRGANWKQVQPTLRGNGRLAIANGKLLGVNVVAIAINTIAGAPGIKQLVDAAFMSSHRGMMVNPDTDLTRATMSFDLSGQRFTTHDLVAQSEFYGIRGDGWFDMDSNVDMSMDLQLTFGLSVAIPVVVQGKWPSVVVLPDIPKLAERLAMGALSLPEKILKGGESLFEQLLP